MGTNRVAGVVPALLASSAGQIFSAVVQTRSLALHNVAAAKGTRFARAVVVTAMHRPQTATEVPILSQNRSAVSHYSFYSFSYKDCL